MGGYLAFDREALAMLRLSLDLSLEELTSTLGHDPAATSARSSIRRAASTAGRWLPILRTLSGCSTMEGYTPVGPGSIDLPGAWWTQVAAGRSLVTDPLTPTDEVITPAQARALGLALRQGDLDELLDGDQHWLVAQLTSIGGSTESSAAFLRALGPDRFADLVEVICAPMRVDAVLVADGLVEPAPPPQLALLDALGLTFGVFRTVAEDREKPRWNSMLGEVPPIAATRMVRAAVGIEDAWSDTALIGVATAALAGIDPLTSVEPLDALVGAETIWLLSSRPSAARQFLETGEQALVEQVVLRYDASARGALLIASQQFDPPVGDSVRVRASMLRVVEILTDWPGGLGIAYAPVPLAASLPARLDEYLSPYFGELIHRPELARSESTWTDGTGAADPAHFIRTVFVDDSVRDAFETWAWHAYSAAIATGASAEIIKAAAFAVGAAHDVLGADDLDMIESARSLADVGMTLTGHLPLIGGAAGLAGEVFGGPTLDHVGLDIRDAIARGEMDAVNLELLLKWSAIRSWASRHPSVEWDRPLATVDTGEVKAGDNISLPLDDFDDAVEDWIADQPIDEETRRELLDTIAAVEAGAARGEKFVAGN